MSHFSNVLFFLSHNVYFVVFHVFLRSVYCDPDLTTYVSGTNTRTTLRLKGKLQFVLILRMNTEK